VGFSPVPPSAFLVPAHDVSQVDELHALVGSRFASLPTTASNAGSVGGTALLSVCDALKASGGKIVWFVSSLPSHGKFKFSSFFRFSHGLARLEKKLTGLFFALFP